VTHTFDVAAYWDRRYRDGRSSGAGSEGDEGRYKADYITRFCEENNITSVIDWGVGDGQVLELIQFPKHIAYLGVDVSPTIVKRARERFISPYRFMTVDEYHHTFPIERYNTALSLDVLFHFPDDNDYCRYLKNLFDSATRYVIIYSTNYDGGRTSRHVMRREFTRDVTVLHPEWKLIKIESPLRDGLASFFVYEKVA
jgi:trans-aconitate methyltransferase